MGLSARLRGRVGALLIASWLAPAAARSAPMGLTARPAAAPKPAPAPGPAPAPPSNAPPSAPTPPAPIPIPLVMGRADEALATMARVEARTRDDPELDRVGRALSGEERVIAQIREAAATDIGPVAAERDVGELEIAVSEAKDRLASLGALLDHRADEFQASSAELAALRVTWAATAAAPDLSHAPEPVRERVAEVNDRIAAVGPRMDAYLGRLVELQDRAARVGADLATSAAKVQQARRALDRQLFEIESAPLWTALATPARTGEARRVRATARINMRAVGGYLGSGNAGEWAQLAFCAIAWAALASLRRSRRPAPDEGAAASAVLDHPLLGAAVVTLVLTPLFQPRAPPPLFDLAVLAAVVPWVLVSRPVVPRRLLAPQLAVTALFTADRMTALSPPHALWARLALLGTSAGAVALLASGLRRGGWVSALGKSGWSAAARAGIRAALALTMVAVLANVVGNVTLAARLTRGTLTSALGGVVARGVVLVAAVAVSATLQLETVQRRRIVSLHRGLLQQRSGQVVRWVAFALWAWVAAVAFGVTGPAVAAVSALLGYQLSVGSLHVSLGDLVAFGVTLWVAIVLARLVRFVLDEGILPALPLGRGIPGAISKTAHYAVVGLGALAALYASGIELGKFSLFAGTLGVGIGFGLQNIVNNFVSGLILLYERPVQPGDVIEVGTVSGEVRRIGVRSSTVRTFQGADVIVPNATFISAEVVNWTLTDRTRRAEVAVSVAYGSDPATVKRILLDAVRRDDVLRDPEPVALLTQFADSALQFEVRFWPARFETWVLVASDVRETILRDLTAAGIAIPFPQRDVYVRAVPDPLPSNQGRNVAMVVPGVGTAPPGRIGGTP